MLELLCVNDAGLVRLLLSCFCAAAGCRLISVTADTELYSKVVDIYNSASGTWSTTQLSVGRRQLAATSVGNVAIFAGGYACNCSLALCETGFVLKFLCDYDSGLRRFAGCFLVFVRQQVVVL